MDNNRYWSLFKDEINQILTEDPELGTYFEPIDRVGNEAYQILRQKNRITPFDFSLY